MRVSRLSTIGLVVAFSLTAVGGSRQSSAAEADHKDVAYDDQHASQKLDVYLAESDAAVPVMVFIHGGGWRAGSKARVPAWLLAGREHGDYSVVSVEYRFTDVAPHPAQVQDCLRAIQFVRQHAKEWNMDPDRIGVTGGSAGGHLSLWVATHDDVGRAKSEDPVERQSSRVTCAVSFAGPTDWSLLGEIDHKHPAFRQLVGSEPGTPVAEMNARLMHDVSPINHVSDDDPPMMQIHGTADNVVPIQHAERMDARLKEAGVPSELMIVEGANHGVAGAGPQVTTRAEQFVHQHLLSP